jgi:hypothetical protein
MSNLKDEDLELEDLTPEEIDALSPEELQELQDKDER